MAFFGSFWPLFEMRLPWRSNPDRCIAEVGCIGWPIPDPVNKSAGALHRSGRKPQPLKTITLPIGRNWPKAAARVDHGPRRSAANAEPKLRKRPLISINDADGCTCFDNPLQDHPDLEPGPSHSVPC